LKGSLVRCGLSAIALAVAAGALLGAPPASAQPEISGTFAFSGDAGDYISGGQSYSYNTANSNTLTVTGTDDHNHLIDRLR
jgi:hypothetical protein